MIALPIARPIAAAIATALFSQNSGAYSGPSLRLGFSENTYLMGAIGKPPSAYEFDSLITFTRASGGGITNAAGEFEWVGNDVPRLTYDPVTLQPLGLLVEEQRTNLLVNSVLDGAVVGVLGSGGALPTGWELETAAGLATSVIATGVESGRRYVDIRINGNQNGSFWQLRTNNFATGTAGQSYTSQVTARLLSGSMPNGFRLNTVEATGSFYGTGTTAQLSASYTTLSASRLVALASASMQTRIQHTAYTGAVDCTFRITAPQAELGATPSSYIPTTTAQVTRAADVCSVNTLSPWFNAAEGTLVVRAATTNNGFATVFQFSNGTPSNEIRLIGWNDGSNRLSVIQEGAGFAPALSGQNSWMPRTGSTFKIAADYKMGVEFSYAGNGGVQVQRLSPLSPAGINQLRLGSTVGNLFFLNGTIASIEYYPRVIDVQQASA